MEVLIMAGQLILALTILVFIHELGHFWAARAFGIKAEKFYIFFDAWGKKLFSFKWGDTEWGIGWLPLGGYVKIAGMVDESMDKEQMEKEPQPWEYRARPNYQKFIVLIAGIVMNIILGVIIYTFFLKGYEKSYITAEEINNQGGIYATSFGREVGFQTGDKVVAVNGKNYERYGDYAGLEVFLGADVTVERDGQEIEIEVPDDYFKQLNRGGMVIYGIRNGVVIDSFAINDSARNISYAQQAGIEVGDSIIAVDGKELFSYTHMTDILSENKGGEVKFLVMRGNEMHDIDVTIDTTGKTGIIVSVKNYPYAREKYTMGSAFKYGTKDAFGFFYFNGVAIWKMIKGDVDPRESIASPIGIAKVYGGTWDWGRFWKLTAMISMVLAFMNLLPIPALDGGHLMFVMWEWVTGRKLSDRFMEIAQMVGFILVMALMLFAVGNDLFKSF